MRCFSALSKARNNTLKVLNAAHNYITPYFTLRIISGIRANYEINVELIRLRKENNTEYTLEIFKTSGIANS
jgi:hypothetical protein